jgi:hypothetical protein
MLLTPLSSQYLDGRKTNFKAEIANFRVCHISKRRRDEQDRSSVYFLFFQGWRRFTVHVYVNSL